jgi:long-chain acyl-CoA synthetase
VVDAVVFGVDDQEYGEKLVAMVVVDAPASFEADMFRAFLSGRLAGYKIPRIILPVTQLPRDDSGKLSRRRLREGYQR